MKEANVALPACKMHWRCVELLLIDGTRFHRPKSDTGASPLFIGTEVVTWYIVGYPGDEKWYAVTFPIHQVDQIAEHCDPPPDKRLPF